MLLAGRRSSKYPFCSTIIRSLGSRETNLREAKWANSILLEESVLLLNSEPRHQTRILVESRLCSHACVGWDGSQRAWQHSLAQDNNVVTTTEWIWEDAHWPE